MFSAILILILQIFFSDFSVALSKFAFHFNFMKVAGFSFIRNAIRFDYPIVEAIKSVLPVCDVFYLAIGKSEDETETLILSMNEPKIQIIRTVWDDSLREGGKVLAEETNKAFDAIPLDFDWCFYIQGDEIFHEKDLDTVHEAMKYYLNNFEVEGLLFSYRHFYGSYDFVGIARNWYRHEIRIIRNDKSIRSYRDAQGFRKHGRKLQVAITDASIYHYGWVKHPDYQQQKQLNFNKLWHSDTKVNEMVGTASSFDYSQVDGVKLFKDSHPKVMQERIQQMNWTFAIDPSARKLSLKVKVLDWIEKTTSWRPFEYQNYRIVERSLVDYVQGDS